MSKCPLCSSKAVVENTFLYRCEECDLVFKSSVVSREKEKLRYSTHNNDLEDKGYLSYLNKLLLKTEEFASNNKGLKVLDFGCGPTKGIETLVTKTKERDYKVTSFDPYFFNIDLNKEEFDLIYASECFEHFNKPDKTFKKIMDVLKVEGILAIGTHLHSSETDFSTWWYLKDPTHIVFYSEKTIEYIVLKFNLQILFLNKFQIILKKLS